MSARRPGGLLSMPRIALLALLWLAPPGILPAHGMRLPLVPYSTADGLPSDEVTAILADPDGLVWIGTDGGLALWDGESFRPFGADAGLAGAAIGLLSRGPDGTIWIASDRGVFRLDRGERNGTLTRVTLEGSDGRAITALHAGRSGRVWLADRAHLYVLDPRGPHDAARLVPVTHGPGPRQFASPRAIAETDDGAVWVGFRESGLLRMGPDGTCTWPAYDPDVDPGRSNVRGLLPEPGGRLWAATYGGALLLRADPDRLAVEQVVQAADGLPSSSCGRMRRARSGEILLGTDYGLAVLASSAGGWRVTQTLTAAQGLSNEQVWSLEEDPAGNVWIGSPYQGLRVWARGGFVRMDEVTRPGAQLVQVGDDGTGGVFVLSRERERGLRLDRWRGGRHEASALALPSGRGSAGWGFGERAVVEGGSRWWIASGVGLCLWRAPSSDTLPRGEPDWCAPVGDFAGREMFNAVPAGNGSLWITSYPQGPGPSALARFDPKTRRSDPVPRARLDLAEPFVHLAVTRRGTLWTTLPGGKLARYRDGRTELLDPGEGLRGSILWNLFLDDAGRLWVLGEGVSVCADPDAPSPVFTTPAWSPAVLPLANCALEDDEGRLWFGTQRGVVRVSRDGTSTRRFTQQDGLPSTIIALCHRDGDGGLWFGDGVGVSRLGPGTADPPPPTGPVRIWSVQADGEALPLSSVGTPVAGPYTLRPGTSRVSVSFGMPGFHRAGALAYQFQVEQDGPWSTASPNRRIELVGFRAGVHRIGVRALGEDGVPAGPPAVLTIRVLAPLWQRPWFLALSLAIVGGLAWTGFRLRLRRAVALERIRTRIATDLHDDIGSTLSQIAVLSQVAGGAAGTDPQAARTLDRITGLSGEVIDALSDVVWAINPARDRLRDLVQRMRSYASELFADASVELVLDLPEASEERTDLELRRQVYLVFKEALNNARRHADAGRVTVSLRREGARLELTVRDDGRGFDPTASSTGHGFASMRERARRIGGALEVRSAPGAGTEVTLRTDSYPRGQWWPPRFRRTLRT